MTFLDAAHLDALDAAAFRERRPYPWLNPENLLTDEGWQRLHDELPDVSAFDAAFGKKRKYGQVSHDRYVLEWHPGLELPDAWSDFIAELRGPVYTAFLRRLLGLDSLGLRFHWHYTPRGCMVSPHCDSKHKLGSHIFYFNASHDWDPAWGGETLVLDDGGRFHSDSNPDFDDFDKVETAECLDNRSLIFMRRGDSWHGVRPLDCPDGYFRRVFIVVFEKPGLVNRLLRRVAVET